MENKHKNILVALDGSESAKKAFKKAVEIAKRHDSRLVLAHIVDTQYFSEIGPHLGDIQEQSIKVAEELLNDYEQTAKDVGFTNIKKVIDIGSPKIIITREIIPKESIDLVIVGATGVGAIKRVLIGSVSGNIVRHSKCDVLVVR